MPKHDEIIAIEFMNFGGGENRASDGEDRYSAHVGIFRLLPQQPCLIPVPCVERNRRVPG